jgi:hypothetical protein
VIGKARVAQNSLTHGLTDRLIVLPSKNPNEYDAFRAGLVKALEPEGDLERLLADKIVIDAWRLRRIQMLEAAVHRRSRHDRAIEKAQDAVYETGSAETAAMLTAITRMPLRSNDRVDAERTL